MFHTLWTAIHQVFSTNQFLTGATLTGVILGVANLLRKWLWTAMAAVKNFFTVQMTVHSEDALHLHISSWLYANGFDRFSRNYRVRFIDSEARYGPAMGSFRFFFRHRLLRVSIQREENATNSWSNRSQTREFLTLSYISFRRDRSLLERVVADAVEAAKALRQTGTNVYVYNGGWSEVARIHKSKYPTVVLAAGALEYLEADVEHFLERHDWYQRRGVPWRRGYLLSGPPGTGKTSVVKHLAQRFSLPIHVCDGTVRSINAVPERCILLLEDVDSIATMHRQARQLSDDDDSPKPPVSDADAVASLFAPNLSELLNALDGVASTEGVLVFMTTNHPERLDHAMVRPGRVDVRMELSYCTAEQGGRLFQKFFQTDGAKVRRFEDAIRGALYTPAQIQNVFLEARDEDEAITAFAALTDESVSA